MDWENLFHVPLSQTKKISREEKKRREEKTSKEEKRRKNINRKRLIRRRAARLKKVSKNCKEVKCSKIQCKIQIGQSLKCLCELGMFV